MRLTRASSYALHALAHMAALKRDVPMPSHIIAQKRGIPERFLLKVLKPLVSARILLSIKGPHGGYRLALPARDISLLQVPEAVDGPLRGYAPEVHEPRHALHCTLAQICDQPAEAASKPV